MSNDKTLILRFRPTQRLVHWVGAAGFVALLVTGLALLWSPFSFLAWGGWSSLVHRLGAILFILWPVLYLLLDRRGLLELIRDSFTYSREDLAWLKQMPRYLLGRAAGMPPQGRLNAGEKGHHALTILAFLVVALSGVVLWFGKGALGATGLAVAASVHDASMLVLTVLFVGHLYFTFLYDALESMLKGYVTEEYARMEHANWLAAVRPELTLITAAPAKEDDAAHTEKD